LFPASGEFASQTFDPICEKVYRPLFARAADRFSRLRVLQQGKVHVYLLYIMLAVVLALAWVSLGTGWSTP
jgi:hydrogenase-4 component B